MTVSTDKWKAAWRAINTRQAVAYLDIYTKDNNSFFFATRANVANGIYYDGVVIGNGSVNHRTDFMASDISLANMSFDVYNAPISSAGGKSFSWLLSQTDFIGAEVILQICTMDLDLANDSLVRFYGVIQTIDIGIDTISFRCIQRRDWNKTVTPKVVTRSEYPQALEETVGSPLPIILGNLKGPKVRNPIIPPYGDIFNARQRISGGRRATQCVVVDAGGGLANTGKAKIVASTSPVKQLGANNGVGTAGFIKGKDGNLHAINSQASEVFNDSVNGAGYWIVPNQTTAFAPIYPTAVSPKGSPTNPGWDIQPAFNQETVLDIWNDLSVATFDTSTLQYGPDDLPIFSTIRGVITASFAANENMGTAKHINLIIIYRSAPTLRHFTARITNLTQPDANRSTYIAQLPSTNGEWAIYTSTNLAINTAGMPSDGWSFGAENIELRIGFPSGTWPNNPWYFPWVGGIPTGFVEIMGFGFSVVYEPKQNLITTKKVIKAVRTNRRSDGMPLTTYEQTNTLENVTALKSEVFTNAVGISDDENGTITGTPNGVIETATDISEYLLRNVMSDSNITVDSDFGSFKAARSKLISKSIAKPMIYGIALNESVDANTVISWLAESSVSQPLLSPFTNKWEWHPWELATTTTYPIQISKSDLLDISSGISLVYTPDSNVMSGIRIMYAYDDNTSAFTSEVGASASSSNSGFDYMNMRDGNLSVKTDFANKIDWLGANTGGHIYTIPAGDYTPQSLLTALHTVFLADLHSVSYGFTIIGGVNDTFRARYKLAGAFSQTYTCVISPGEYTPDEFAAAVASAISIKFGNFYVTVSYDYDLRKLKFYYPLSTEGNLNQITFFFDSPNCAASAMGFGMETVSSTPGSELYSSYNCEPERFAIALSEPFDLQWATGPNGLYGNKSSAWEILGFDWSNNSSGIQFGQKRHMGVSPKSNIESLFTASASQYGTKRDVTREHRAIYDTATAIEVRNRISKLMTTPRAIITFSSDVLADLRVGDIFEFNPDINQLQDCPIKGSNGDWSNRKWRVLETSQKFGSSWHTEIVAVDLTS